MRANSWPKSLRVEANPNMYETLFFDAGHPTSDGLKLFAEEVESFLIAEGWFVHNRVSIESIGPRSKS